MSNRRDIKSALCAALAIAGLFGLFSACAMDVPADGDEQEHDAQRGLTLEEPLAEETLTETNGGSDEEDVEGDDPSALAGCSVVQYCDAPGGDGTVCRQTGCSEQAAKAECAVEAPKVCGDPKCPWYIVYSSGARSYFRADCQPF